MFRLRSLLALCTALAMTPAMAASETRPIVVAQAADLSGANADFGRDYTLGAKIYFDHVNAGGGIHGRRIAYRSQDSGGVPARGLAAAQAFVREGAGVLFGFTGDDTVIAVARDKAIRTAGVPLFAPVAANTSLGSGDGVHYLRADVAREIQAMVAHLATTGIKTFAIATVDEHGKEASRALDAESAKLGARVVARTSMAANGDGPVLAAQTIARERPQAVIVIADTLAVARFFQRYRQLDPGAFLCAPSLVNVRTLTTAIGTQAARGIIVSQVVPDPTSAVEIAREHRKLMERYADEPASQATLEGFIAAKALVQELRRSRDGGSALGQTIRSEGRLDLGGYALNFAGNGRASDYVELTVVSRDGRLLR